MADTVKYFPYGLFAVQYKLTDDGLLNNWMYSAVNGDILLVRTSVSVRATLNNLWWQWAVSCIIWK